MRLHIDTDLGEDPDDACALAMVLGWRDADLVAVTTTLDADGERAGCARYCLRLAGRGDVPVASGAGASLATLARFGSTWDDGRYWPELVAVRRSAPGAALTLLAESVDAGATVVAIGAYTNLALLEVMAPGILTDVRVVVMGGWIRPPALGLPQWGPEKDTNVQRDVRAAEIVMASGADLTFATLPATMQAQLQARDLPRLEAAGPLGRLLARQARAYGSDHHRAALAGAHDGLHDDLLNFHYDPVACAVALGWPNATVHRMPLATTVEDGVLRLSDDPSGRPVNVLVDLDAEAFSATWLTCVEAAAGR